MSSSRVVRFDFQKVIIESGEGVVVRDAGHLPARELRLDHGAAADDAARCVGGLTAIRSASTKATACPAALQYFNHEFWELTDPRRTRRTKRWRPVARTKVGEAASRPFLLARTSRGLTVSRTFVMRRSSVLRTIYLSRLAFRARQNLERTTTRLAGPRNMERNAT